MHDNALIDPQPPASDARQVEAVFAMIEESLGFVPDGLRLYGVSPPLLKSFVTAIGHFRGQDRLSQELLATIRYLSASRNHCEFCIDFNEAILLQLGKDQSAIRASRDNPDAAPLPESEKALLKLALDALEDADAIDAARLDGLRQQGWRDRDIFEAVYVAANNRAFTTVLKTFGIHKQGQLSARARPIQG